MCFTQASRDMAASVSCLSRRETNSIKPHYLQGYHLPQTRAEIGAYLLVNNNITDKVCHPIVAMEAEEGGGSGERGTRDFQGTVSFCRKGKQRETSRRTAQMKAVFSPGLNGTLNKKHNQTPSLKV